MSVPPNTPSSEADFHQRAESVSGNQKPHEMTTPNDSSHLYEASDTSEEISPVSKVHTAHASESNGFQDADYLNPADSRHHINKIQPGFNEETGQVEVVDDTLASLRPHVLQPITQPAGHPALDFRPIMLQRKITIILALLFLLIGLSTGILMYRAGSDNQFRFTNNNVHFAAQYVPSIIGTVSVLLFRAMAHEFLRMTPYISMADYRGLNYDGAKVEQSIAFRYFPQLLWNMSKGLTLFADISLVLVSLLIVPSKTALIATEKQNDDWVLTVRGVPAWGLIGGYALMTIFTLTVTIWLWSRQTGLKWDPVSLADQLALFRNSNTLSYFKELELNHRSMAWRVNILRNTRFRLGYWLIGRPGDPAREDIWYGIGAINHENRQLEDSATKVVGPVLNDTGSNEPPSNDKKASTDESGNPIHSQMENQEQNPNSGSDKTTSATRTDNAEDIEISSLCRCGDVRCENYPYRHSPLVHPIPLIFWIIIAYSGFFLCLYTLTSGHIQNGFWLANTWYDYLPHLSNESSNGGSFTSTNTNQTLLSGDLIPIRGNLFLYAFVFRALPTAFAGFFVGFMTLVGINYSFIQSFVGMYKTPGSASETLLLEYFAASPLKVPLDAWGNGHWKVAWFSILSTISPVFPIVVGGMFTITNTGKRVYFEYSVPAFSIVFAFLGVYCVSLAFAWPTKNRLLPRRVRNLADIMSMCHKSRFLWRPDFDISNPKTTKQHMVARIFLREDRYLFGAYNGTDGEEHLGFDMAGSSREPTNNVEWVQPIPRKNGWISHLRRRVGNRQQQQHIEGIGTGPSYTQSVIEDESVSNHV